jgi:hypothetical protein
MVAWKAYQQTETFQNNKHWALVIAQGRQLGAPEDKTAAYELRCVPLAQRDQSVMGALWGAFMAGYAAAGGKVSV